MPTNKSKTKTTDSTTTTAANVVSEETTVAMQKRKRKKRSPGDEAYTKKTKGKKKTYQTVPHKGFFGRVNTEKFLKDETGAELKDSSGAPVPLKMSLLINQQSYSKFDLAQLDQIIFDACSKHPVFRPVAAVVQANPTTGSPQKISTPHKTILHRIKSFGTIHYFSNDPLTKPIEELKAVTAIDPAFFQTDAYQAVVMPSQQEKSSHVEITHKLLKETHHQTEMTSGRGKSQNAVMARPGVDASLSGAPSYTESAQVLVGADTEYAHHIPYFVLGSAAQKEENLSITSAHTNTDQLITYESMLKFLAKEYANDKITLDVKSELIDKTQISRKLWVTLETPHHTYSFEFDPKNVNKPHLFQHESFKILMKSTVKQGIENKMLSQQQPETMEAKTSTQKMRLFYKPEPPLSTQVSPITYETQPTKKPKA